MKPIYFVLAFGLLIGTESCQKESDLFDKLSPEDELAVEGMEETYGNAKLYNDSLQWCDDPNNHCDQTFIEYCDSIFHFNSDEFEMHHNNYSHNNVSDDHHHSANGEHEHGDAEHEEGGDDGHNEHSTESHFEMNELQAEHEPLHP